MSTSREFSFRDRDFRFLAGLIGRRTGIVIGNHKRDLVYGRLSRRLRELKLRSFADYCELLRGDEGDGEIRSLVNAVTTNLTAFFREKHHFDHLGSDAVSTLAAHVDATGHRRLRIWSAGCSSGEEAYSIAMTLRANLPEIARWDVRILATDIDTNMIATGQAGVYPAERVRPVPTDYRRRFVEPRPDGSVRMSEEIRSMIVFRSLNLLGDWPMHGPFDAIFCRNVVIYFDKPTQARLFGRFADLLAADGWLYLGHSESLFNVTDRFRPAGRTIYRRAS